MILGRHAPEPRRETPSEDGARRAASASRSVLVFRRSRSCSPHLDHPGVRLSTVPYMIVARPPLRTCVRREVRLRMRARGHLTTTPRTPAASEETARGRRSAGCWRVFQRLIRVCLRARSVRAHLPTPTSQPARRCAPFGRAPRCLAFPLAIGGGRIRSAFRTEPQACSAAFAASRRFTGAFRHPLTSAALAAGFRRTLSKDASVLILRSVVHRPTPIARIAFRVSRRSRSNGTSVLTFAHVFARVPKPPRAAFSFDLPPAMASRFRARPHTCPLGAYDPNEHTHCARSYSAYCHRESLARSSRFEPPCSSFRDFRPDLRIYRIAPVFA